MLKYIMSILDLFGYYLSHQIYEITQMAGIFLWLQNVKLSYLSFFVYICWIKVKDIQFIFV